MSEHAGRIWVWMIVAALAGALGCEADTDADPAATTGDAAVSGDVADGGAPPADVGPEPADAGPPPVVSDRFSVRGTIGQIYIWNAPVEAAIEVLAPGGQVQVTGATDDLGSLVVRELAPGVGYSVWLADEPEERTEGIEVLSLEGSLPDPSFYASQTLKPGFGYVTMRDGTQLSVFVSLPGPLEDGPYPTIVNYSGYSPSKPGESMGAAAEPFCGDFPVLCDAPGHPSGLLAGIGGYASVGVNMRGTGCSGGAYDFFEPLQLTDGYDVIEIVARQSWVAHGHVGMAGLSYPGISQLFVAKMRPPSLAAITPLSVIADTGSSTLIPGGIYNNGFALSWIEHVLKRADPYGHKWIEDLVAAGDTVCEEHQKLHGQKLDVIAKALANPYYSDEVAKPVDPSSFVHEIEVPVFLAGQWQDEQTGPHFAALLDKFTGTDVARFVVGNGVHSDGYSPQVLMDWKIFLDLYVARTIPGFTDQVRALVPLFYAQSLGVALELPPNRFAGYTSYEEALADYEAEPALRVIFDSGADPTYAPGAPQGTFERHYDAWPLPGTQVHRLYLQPGGVLGSTAPGADGGASQFHHDPDAGARTTLNKGSVDQLQPAYEWAPLAEGMAVAWETPPLTEDHVYIGHGSVDLWLRSTATDADLEVNLTEVRPDGQEHYVQSGWLRASHRALRDDATELRPVKSHRKEDLQPLVPDEWHEVRVEIMPFAHVFRAGSTIRLSVDTPGDSRASWTFLLLDHTDAEAHTIGHSAAYPSSVALPRIDGVVVPTALPEACTALRGQPCREYLPLENLAAP